MFILSIFLVLLFTRYDAQCSSYSEPDVYELLISLQNKLDNQAAKISLLEDTISSQEKQIADLSETVTSHNDDKKKMRIDLEELKLKSAKQERTIKRLVNLFSQSNMEANVDDTNTYDHEKVGDIQKAGNTIDGKKRFVLDTLETVAFEATIAAAKFVQHSNIHDIVVFDDVSLNVGNGYKPGNGTFIAPLGGIYIFSTSVMMHGASTQDLNMHVILEKNNVEIAGAFAYNQGAYEHSSVTATMDLQAGDTVAVTVERHNDITFYGDRLTSFTGFLLYSY